MRLRLLTLHLCAVLLVCASTASAQTTGRIVGTILDQQNAAVPGATVTVGSPALQGMRSTVTDQGGEFRFLSLPPGTYTLNAELTGFQRVERSNIIVGLDQTVTLPLTLTIAGVAQAVTVTATSPTVDITSTTGGIVATADVFNNLPIARNIYAITDLAPGVTSDAVGPSFGGATGAENIYIIEGLNTTDARYGGIGKRVNFDFVDQVQVLTDGMNAEYGRLTGGAVNAITKSGSNTFRGSLFAFGEGGALQANDSTASLRPETTTTVSNLTKLVDGGFDLGGFLVQDRLWFYGAYDGISQRREASIIRVVDAPGAPSLGSTIPTDVTTHTFAGKLTWRASNDHTITGTVWGDPSNTDGALFAIAGPESTWKGTLDTGGTNSVIRWDGIFGPTALIRAQFGQNRQKAEYGGPGTTITQLLDLTVVPNGRTGGFAFFQDNEFTRNQLKADVTKFWGGHEVMVGGDIENMTSIAASAYGGGQLIYKLPPRSTTAGRPYYRHRFFVSDRIPGFVRTDPTTWQLAFPLVSEPETQNASFYARDNFKVLSNLSINVGLRWEKQNLLDRDGVTAGVDEATNNPGMNLNYWAPRIGFVWDPTKAAKSKIYASWGRYYESIPADIQIRAFGGEAICFCYNLDPSPSAVQPDTTIRAYSLLGGKEPVEPELRGQYQDETVVGFEREVMANTTVGVKVLYRDLGNVIEDFLVPSIGDYFIANPGGGTLGHSLNMYDGTVQPAPKAERKNTAVELSMRKRYSENWQVLASYVWQKLEGNYDGTFQNSTGQLDPNINSAFDYGDFLVNAHGPLTNQRKHQVKLDGSYTFSGRADGLTLGGSFRVFSGYPLNAYAYSFLYQNWEYFIAPRGSLGNAPAEWEGDVHVAYPIKLGGVPRLNVILDVFNIFNRQALTAFDERFNLANHGACGGIPDALCNGDNGLQHAPNSATTPIAQLPNVRAAAPNPDFLKAGQAFTGQASARLGVRFTF